MGGSHEAFAHSIMQGTEGPWRLLSLPAVHWKWHMRAAPLHFAQALNGAQASAIFASSYLALHEFLGFAPQLAHCPSLLYFHENQFAYPDRGPRPDMHYAVSQVMAAHRADRVVFNSRFNLTSFIEGARKLFRQLPKPGMSAVVEAIAAKAQVVGIPLSFEPTPQGCFDERPVDPRGPVILWPHRWEHDKAPQRFFAALSSLQELALPFRLVICGESFARYPAIFDQAKARFAAELIHWGYARSRGAYLELLRGADIAVSCADHEFFGVAMLEACYWGAFPLAPARLAYPEHFKGEHLYQEDADLGPRLADLVRRYLAGARLRRDRRELVKAYEAEGVLRRLEALMVDSSG